ncbi:Rv3654c family TadE-like protein [Sinomonas sp. JGH33]|uniref:Rv3654c family TadE-like protein n=1 Tax=Sinomonas terricola TaxID=3110330 RepID=A0ABU5T2B1_9MICC|nr:Rv3654c family TadE-like protein [Sinomonas sp. JGH33]MEA5453795.1 Rv3654c family TadE-like protein [Sinomonas sp. JGH33]
MSRRDRERGAGTILALGLVLVVLVVCGAAVLVSQGLAAAARSARVADLAALAAADAERGLVPGGTCPRAIAVARLNGAALVSCEVESPGRIVRVIVTIPAPAGLGVAEGRARAGSPP